MVAAAPNSGALKIIDNATSGVRRGGSSDDGRGLARELCLDAPDGGIDDTAGRGP